MSHRGHLKAATLPPKPEDAASSTGSTRAAAPPDDVLPTGRRAERMHAHHALVHGLLNEGMGLRAIARHLGWGRHTVQRYARAARWQDAVTGRRTRPSHLDVHRPYLQRRIDESGGAISIKKLREELADQGRLVPYSSLRDWARSRLQWPTDPARPPAPPSVRQVTGWLTRRPATLSEDEHQQLKTVLNGSPELATAHQLVRDFADMLTQQTGVLLSAWIEDATEADLPGLTSFARGLTSDLDAVTAGLPVSHGRRNLPDETEGVPQPQGQRAVTIRIREPTADRRLDACGRRARQRRMTRHMPFVRHSIRDHTADSPRHRRPERVARPEDAGRAPLGQQPDLAGRFIGDRNTDRRVVLEQVVGLHRHEGHDARCPHTAAASFVSAVVPDRAARRAHPKPPDLPTRRILWRVRHRLC
ncbi:transposase [Streptomyces sp. NPDC019531]|uniref:DesA/ISL3 alpha bundle tail domain-containing protein n=1 Tax=Streptomyces sp. NPDC019531 TaxID=3365062 RepID=UPI00384FF0B5